MRYLKIGEWSSAVHDWTLCAFSISDPKYRRSTVTVPGSDGAIDLSDALDGAVHYDQRKITARLENSCGTRQQRSAWISHIVNALDGMEKKIEMPDDPARYMVGRLRVAVQYNDPAHASVQITADVDPWKYKYQETEYQYITENAGTNTLTAYNNGRKTVVPSFVVVVIYPGDILKIGNYYIETTGTYQFPEIKFAPGENTVDVMGRATILVKFREGIL